MASIQAGIYQRGEFWLDLVRGAGGKPASSRWYIWWYDPGSGHQRRKSTGTDDVRLAADELDAHYLSTHHPTQAEQDVYTVAQAMTDYWLLHGQHQSSADAIKARLKLMSRFLDHEADEGRLIDPFLPESIDDQFLVRFRAWGVADPIVARKKDHNGNWVDGASRPRTAATVEESVIQLKAAIKHAFDGRRLRHNPPIKHKPRSAVTPKRNDRMSLAGIGELLNYTLAGGGKYTTPQRLIPLRRYVIASICTLGRPDAILDMNLNPGRAQWQPEANLFDLNPAGRIQTKKRRPVLPVVPLLRDWFDATDEWFICQERLVFDADLDAETIIQSPVSSIRSAWDSARDVLGIPAGRGPKYLRHSMSTILANRGVPRDEISLVLGHRILDPTTEAYVIYDPDYLSGFRAGLEDVLGDLMKMAGPALRRALNCDARAVSTT